MDAISCDEDYLEFFQTVSESKRLNLEILEDHSSIVSPIEKLPHLRSKVSWTQNKKLLSFFLLIKILMFQIFSETTEENNY